MRLESQLILRDVDEARNVPTNDDRERYKKVYPWSNENMQALFRNFSIEDKDVLTVIGSGDQVFESLYNGAKNVDAFDCNKLAIYYYFLRKWLIKYKDIAYPGNDFFLGREDEVAKVVFMARTTSILERKAKLFWMHYLSDKFNRGLFFSHNEPLDSNFSKDLDGLKKKLNTRVNIRLKDVTREYDSDRKYDVIIFSNILEHIHHDDELAVVRRNIEGLLKDDGICVCSHLMYDSRDEWYNYEVEQITRGILEHEELNDSYDYLDKGYKQEVGYVYRKRR